MGDACEVAGSAEDRFAAAWFRGQVVARWRPSEREAVSDDVQVCFPDFVRPDGAAELEVHPARSLRVRPAQAAPAVTASLDEYQAGAAQAGAVGSGCGWVFAACSWSAGGQPSPHLPALLCPAAACRWATRWT